MGDHMDSHVEFAIYFCMSIIFFIVLIIWCYTYINLPDREIWNIRVFSGGKQIYAVSGVKNTSISGNCCSFTANDKGSPRMTVCGDLISERVK